MRSASAPFAVAATIALSGSMPHPIIAITSFGALPCGLNGVPASVEQMCRTPARIARRWPAFASSTNAFAFVTA
jgi:hypothetical protein